MVACNDDSAYRDLAHVAAQVQQAPRFFLLYAPPQPLLPACCDAHDACAHLLPLRARRTRRAVARAAAQLRAKRASR